MLKGLFSNLEEVHLLLKSPDPMVVKNAATALGKIQHPSSLTPLLKKLGQMDGNESCYQEVLLAVMEVGRGN